MGLAIAIGALALSVSTVVLWMRMIKRVEIGARRGLASALFAAGGVLALVAFGVGVGTLAAILAGLSLLVCTLYFGLLALAGQSKQAPAVAVGAALPDFSAPDENGETFELSSLRGHPVLLKFFRGHW